MPDLIRHTAVLVAMPREAAAFGVKLRLHESRELSPSLRLRVTGVGARSASRGAQNALVDGAHTLVSFGYCAALAPELAVGALVLPEQLATSVECRQPSPDLLRAAGQNLDAVGGGIADAADALLRTPADKAALRARSGAVIADMETLAIARIAGQIRGSRLLVVRAVSDGADALIPRAVAASLSDDGVVSGWRLALGLLRRPGEIAALRGLANGAKAADESLRSAAEGVRAVFANA